jgi:hypothetical protein
MAHQAQETFVADLSTGPLRVHRGEVFADNHEVVKLDDGRGLLFKPLDVDEKPAQPPRRAAKGA